MCGDKMHFKAFLDLCRKSGLTVWAEPDLIRHKGTPAHWFGNDNIAVHRSNLKPHSPLRISPETTEVKLIEFVDSSPDIKREMALLLHEYGHWASGHPHLSGVDNETGYRQEVEAWDKGREIAATCGVQDFSVFEAEREKSLKSYRDGLALVHPREIPKKI